MEVYQKNRLFHSLIRKIVANNSERFRISLLIISVYLVHFLQRTKVVTQYSKLLMIVVDCKIFSTKGC